MTRPTIGLADRPTHYGLVSRVLHWGMAALFLAQLTSAAAHLLADDTPIEAALWPAHVPVGVTLFLLVFLRGVWGLLNLGRRPPRAPGLPGLAARFGHLALYALMVTVPSLALLRAYGSGRGLEVLGLQIFAPGGERIGWMVEAGSLLHGELGWTLFALIAGHVGMAIAHRHLIGEDVLPRMGLGRSG